MSLPLAKVRELAEIEYQKFRDRFDDVPFFNRKRLYEMIVRSAYTEAYKSGYVQCQLDQIEEVGQIRASENKIEVVGGECDKIVLVDHGGNVRLTKLLDEPVYDDGEGWLCDDWGDRINGGVI